MINLINGSLQDPQENIHWVENKSSANIILNTHSWKEGEVLVVGYEDGRDIMIGLGIKKGVGPSCYRTIIDQSVVVVEEVLKQIPDVSYYAFDQRYVIRENEDLFFTRRYVGSNGVKVEKIKIEDKCVIIETSTGNIWICNPPSLINFFDLTTKSTIENIVDLGNGQIMIDLINGGKTWGNLCFVSPEEKSYLSEMVFDRNFEVSMVGQKFNYIGSQITSDDPCFVVKTVYTLTSKYSGKLTDLDECPEGWERTELGVYEKTIYGNLSSTSGSVICKLTVGGYTGTKTLESISVTVGRYVFIIYSPTEFSKIEGADRSILSTSPSLGMINITPPKDSYTWFAFPVSMEPTQITQLGINYVSEDTKIISGVIKSDVNLGDYVVYRSLNPGNGESQEVNIE